MSEFEGNYEKISTSLVTEQQTATVGRRGNTVSNPDCVALFNGATNAFDEAVDALSLTRDVFDRTIAGGTRKCWRKMR